MSNSYRRFLNQNINTASLGIERRTNEAAYFCTPKGASIIGWSGVDGIHFCFIRGFGETVFAVSPMNTAPDYVHPLAKNFTDFLRLLLACGDAAVLEQAWMWNKAEFEDFLKENPATQEQKQTLDEIAEKMKLTAIEQPWEYIKSVQASFDYSKIKYTEDYYDIDMNPSAEPTAPQWKVFFDGSFWGHHGKDHAGKEINIGKQFEWAGYNWYVPAAYVCSKGLVIDLCMRVEAEKIRSFMEKWNLVRENNSYVSFTKEQQTEMNIDNPLCMNFSPLIEVNGHKLRTSHGCSVCFNSCMPDGIINELEAKWVLEHYKLDNSYGWVIFRNASLWKSKRCPEIKTLSLIMEQDSVPIPGPHFKVSSPKDSFSFIHPINQTQYTLTVQEIEQQTLPKNCFRSERLSYPTHFTVMSYTLSPEASAGRITVSDCDDSDQPIEIKSSDAPFLPEARNDVAVGIIGGADGPTALVFGGNSQGKLCTACSALRFEPVGHDTEWRITFHEKMFDNSTLKLI